MNPLKNKMPLNVQNKLLADCIHKDIALFDALVQRGFTYDSLRYTEYSDVVPQGEVVETLDNKVKSNATIPAVSFFSGAGGLNIGFEYAGFDNLVSIEFNEVFCNTLRRNYQKKAIIGPPNHSGDVRNHEEIAALLEFIIGANPFDGVFHGGPPCQPFSIAANQRFSKDSDKFKRQGFDDEEKGELLFDYLWYIKKFMPRAFLIENVAGIADCDIDGKIKT
ncbi:MAG: DNA cytosine methyltransferase, partial [Oscillospiraceae bacterium]|nr:DNA cytosine methyltransferase [Oscillospiraceae bacterium]